jgi:hypothetical protein
MNEYIQILLTAAPDAGAGAGTTSGNEYTRSSRYQSHMDLRPEAGFYVVLLLVYNSSNTNCVLYVFVMKPCHSHEAKCFRFLEGHLVFSLLLLLRFGDLTYSCAINDGGKATEA